MHPQATADRGPICVARGYGLKIHVHRGHLVVEDGVGRDRQTRRYSRATSQLKRLVVIGHTGYVSLDAFMWLRGVGASFAQIDSDGQLIAVSANKGGLDSWRRRAQSLASLTGADIAIVRDLLATKLDGQARVAARLHTTSAWLTHDHGRIKTDIPTAISELAEQVREATTFDELRAAERVAARYYWKAWRDLPVRYTGWWAGRLPEHWATAGTRNVMHPTDRTGLTSPRYAITPVMAAINYAYAILATEATITAHEFGLDPSVGFMHTSRRHQRDLISDLMEPARPVADEMVLNLLASRPFDRGDVQETKDGRCRLGTTVAHELALTGPRLYEATQPHCLHVVQTLLQTTKGQVPSRARRVGRLVG
jgi:CRISPR-associated protein Cas1